jgi:hypothetical protein
MFSWPEKNVGRHLEVASFIVALRNIRPTGVFQIFFGNEVKYIIRRKKLNF